MSVYQRQPTFPCLLPSRSPNRNYTLVLDLDETLVHFVTREKKFKLRPGCLWFLKEMSRLFEVVVFTAAAKDYADFILDIVERRAQNLESDMQPESTDVGDGTNTFKEKENREKFISHRLYRSNCFLESGVFIKDLSRLGRPLENTIIVDNIRDNFCRQKSNGIEITTWVGDAQDRELQRLG